MSDERWFVDTNVLLAATDTSRSTHLAAIELWQHFPQEGIRLAFSGQVLREYAVVATRPIANNGLGLSLTHTIDNLRSFRSRCDFLPETELVSRLWSEMVVAYRVQGKRQHDVNIAATLFAAGLTRLVTDNPADFTFLSLLECFSTSDAAVILRNRQE